ncbi:MAG: HlyC/CorC family transporter [Clostridia bacterium]|nr:HlyC/CorC family transporter [Clostridia bacterium]
MFIVLGVLIALSAFFSASETAFSSMNEIRMKNYAKEGNKKAKTALKIAQNYDKALSTILIGNNIVNIASASLGTVIATILFGANGAWISTIAMTILVLIFGEILPKSFAKENAENFALKVAGILRFLMKLFSPLVWFFISLRKLVAGKKEKEQPSVTEEELKVIMQEIQDEGVLEEQESELAQSALEFDEIDVDEIFTPRVDVAAVDVEMEPEEVKNLFFTCKFSRMPVYEGQIDNVIGILHEREFLSKLLSGEPIDLRSLAREALFIPQSLKISLALAELQKKKQQMAIVVDDYGGTAGVITVEDILEELVGEIWDEDEEIEEDVVLIAEQVYEVNAQANIYDVFDQVGVQYKEKELSGGSNTVGGWILDTLQDIPEENETFSFHNVTVTVKEMEDQRIQTVRMEVTPIEEQEETEEE